MANVIGMCLPPLALAVATRSCGSSPRALLCVFVAVTGAVLVWFVDARSDQPTARSVTRA